MFYILLYFILDVIYIFFTNNNLNACVKMFISEFWVEEGDFGVGMGGGVGGVKWAGEGHG